MTATAEQTKRLFQPGLSGLAEKYAGGAGRDVDPLALDPHAFIRMLKVPDVATKRPIPFVEYTHQEEIVDWFVDLDGLRGDVAQAVAEADESQAFLLDVRPRFRNLHCEKTRQMGDTWEFAAIALWSVSYWPVAGLVTHLKQRKVDDGGSKSTVESFFGKIRYLWRSLPAEHRAPLDFTYLLIRNVANGGYVLGEGASSDPGRGGTYDFVVVDEAARLPYGQSAQNALIQACPNGRAYLSTPWGKDIVFYGLRERRPGSFRFFRHHWSRHPVYALGIHVAGDDPSCLRCRATRAGVRWNPTTIPSHRYPGKKTSPWYDQANAEYEDDADVAQELDIDYSASLPARVFPEWSAPTHALSPAEIQERFGRDVLFDAKLNPELAWDYGADTNSVLILQDLPDSLRVCGEYEIGDSLPEDVVAGVLEVCADLGVPIGHLAPHRTRRWLAVGDPAGEGRQQATGRPLVTDYRTAGISIQSRQYGGGSVVYTIRAAKRLLLARPKPIYVDEARCPLFVRHIENNRWPVDAQGRRKLDAQRPLNDEHNHMMRAFAYYATFKYPPPRKQGDDAANAAAARVPSARFGEVRYGDIL